MLLGVTIRASRDHLFPPLALQAPKKNSTSPRQVFLIGVFWLIISIPLAVVLRLFAGIVFLLGLIFMFAGYVGNQERKKKLQKHE